MLGLSAFASASFRELPVVCQNLVHAIRRVLIQDGSILELAAVLLSPFGMHDRELPSPIVHAQLTGWLVALRALHPVHGICIEHAADGWHGVIVGWGHD